MNTPELTDFFEVTDSSLINHFVNWDFGFAILISEMLDEPDVSLYSKNYFVNTLKRPTSTTVTAAQVEGNVTT